GLVLVRGPELLRTAAFTDGRLALTGDTARRTALSLLAPGATRSVTWNGQRVALHRAGDGWLRTVVPGAAPVRVPALRRWRFHRGGPEVAPGFAASRWTAAAKMTTNNPTPPVTLPVLYADDYGFHHGDVWYRGRFTATGGERGVTLSAI